MSISERSLECFTLFGQLVQKKCLLFRYFLQQSVFKHFLCVALLHSSTLHEQICVGTSESASAKITKVQHRFVRAERNLWARDIRRIKIIVTMLPKQKKRIKLLSKLCLYSLSHKLFHANATAKISIKLKCFRYCFRCLLQFIRNNKSATHSAIAEETSDLYCFVCVCVQNWSSIMNNFQLIIVCVLSFFSSSVRFYCVSVNGWL